MRICFWNNEQVCTAATDYDIGLNGHVWLDIPVNYDENLVYVLNNGIIETKEIKDYDPQRLRIYRKLPLTEDPLISDFSILGFNKIAPHYDMGRKIKAEYKDPLNNDLIVEKIFKDVRDVNNRLSSLEITFNWYEESGDIGLTKTETVKNYNKAESETEERKRRERAIDFLISEARYTANEPHINTLMLHYEQQINHFKAKSSDDFAQALQSENNANILEILSARVPFASNELYTVPIKESILYQIGALSEAELMATLVLA